MRGLGFLICVLLLFVTMSTLRVDSLKSVLIPIGEVTKIPYLAHSFSCGINYLPSFYLCLLFGVDFKSKVM